MKAMASSHQAMLQPEDTQHDAAAPQPAVATSEEPEWLTQLMQVMQEGSNGAAAADAASAVPSRSVDSPPPHGLAAEESAPDLLADDGYMQDDDEFAGLEHGAPRQGGFHQIQYTPEPAPPHLITNVSGPLVALPEEDTAAESEESEVSVTEVPPDTAQPSASSGSEEDVEAAASPYADARPSGCGSDEGMHAEQPAAGAPTAPDMSHLQVVPLDQPRESASIDNTGSVVQAPSVVAGASFSRLQGVPIRNTNDSAASESTAAPAQAGSTQHNAAFDHLQEVQLDRLRSSASLPRAQPGRQAAAAGHGAQAGPGLPPVLQAAFSAAAAADGSAQGSAVPAQPSAHARQQRARPMRSTQSDGDVSEMQWEPSGTTYSLQCSGAGQDASAAGYDTEEQNVAPGAVEPLRQSLRARYSLSPRPQPPSLGAVVQAQSDAQSAPLPGAAKQAQAEDAVLNTTTMPFSALATSTAEAANVQHAVPDDEYRNLVEDWSASYQSGDPALAQSSRASPDADGAQNAAPASPHSGRTHTVTTATNAAQQHIAQQFAIKQAGIQAHDGAASVLVQAGSFNEPRSPRAGSAALGNRAADASLPLPGSAAASAAEVHSSTTQGKRLPPLQVPDATPTSAPLPSAGAGMSPGAQRQPSTGSVHGLALSTAAKGLQGQSSALLSPTAHDSGWAGSTASAPVDASTTDLRQIVRELSLDATADLTPLANSVAHHPAMGSSAGSTTAEQRRSSTKTLFQRMAAKLGAGGTKLPPHLAAQAQRVLSVGRQRFDDNSAVHRKALQLLYARYMHAACPGRKGDHWEVWVTCCLAAASAHAVFEALVVNTVAMQCGAVCKAPSWQKLCCSAASGFAALFGNATPIVSHIA